MRATWIGLMLLLAGAGVVQAQVAAPQLDPGSFKNPAVLPFSPASHAGASYGDVDTTKEVDTSGNGVTDTTRTSSSKVLVGQVKLVGGGVAFVVGGGRFEGEGENDEEKTDFREVSLGLNIGDVLGLGGSWNSSSTQITDKASGAVTSDSDISGSLGGAVFRLGEIIYFGAVAGKEVRKARIDFNFLDAPIDIEIEARIRRYGAGLYRRDGDSGYHVEVYREEVEPDDLEIQGTITLPGPIVFPVTGSFSESTDTNGVTLEYLSGNFLFGIQSESSETQYKQGFTVIGLGSSTTEGTEEEKTTEVSLGYVPQEGGALILNYKKGETTDSVDPDTSEFELVAVSLAVQF